MNKLVKHFSDTIWKDKNWEVWITWQRIRLWYKILAKKIWLDIWDQEYHGSTFWESHETWAQALKYLLWLQEWSESEVILVNNASRAKHHKSWEAKWSDCLVWELTINWTTHYLVWVDDEVFTVFNEYKKATDDESCDMKIKVVKWIDYQTEDDSKLEVDDLSKWTQFRSKEHFPLAQLLLIKELKEKGVIDIENWVNWLVLEDFNYDQLTPEIVVSQIKDRVAELLEWGHSEEEVKEETWELIEQYAQLVPDDHVEIEAKDYVPWLEWIEKVLLLWELQLIRNKFGDVFPWLDDEEFRNEICSPEIVRKYNELRASLSHNQIALVHRDLFGNGFLTTKWCINGWIETFCEELWYTLWDTVKIKWEKLNWEEVSFEVILTKTISDHTWENCAWNSSGRWPEWEWLLNVNKSIDSSYEVLWEIQDLPIGTVLTIEKIS